MTIVTVCAALCTASVWTAMSARETLDRDTLKRRGDEKRGA